MKLPVTPRFILTTFLTVLVVICMLLTLWVRQTADNIFSNRSDELVIRAVLKPNATEETANALFQRLSKETPGLRGEVIGPAAGRALLSLQEPWIAQLPDVEIDPLPILIEMHHPQLIVAPDEVEAFNEKLRTDPLVEFVAFNQTGHTRLVELLNNSRGLVYHVTNWLLPILVLLAAAVQALGNLGLSGKRYPYTAGISALTSVLIAWALAALFMNLWHGSAARFGMFSRLELGIQIRWIFFTALASVLAAVVMNLKLPFFSREKK